MKRPSGKVEWTTAEDEDEESWQAQQGAPVSWPAAARPFDRKELMLAALIAITLLILLGGWFVRRAGVGSRAELQNATGHEEGAPMPARPAAAPFEKDGQVEKVQWQGDRAMVVVIARYPEEGKMRAYRETRFYARGADEWQRIPPDPDLLGPEKTLKIANFTILYHAVDADAIYEAAPKVEERYALLRQDFGLPAVDATSGYTIEVSTDRVRPLTNFNYFRRQMTVSSPILLSTPVEMTPATLLYQELVYQLARLTLDESIEPHDAQWRSRFLTSWPAADDALTLWEVWEAGGPLADGREEVVRWLYQNGKDNATSRPLPADYEALCRTYSIWQLMPSDLAIPLTCSEKDRKMVTFDQYPRLASTWTQQSDTPIKGASLDKSPYAAVVTIESILEYVVATYGRDNVPQLVNALGNHTSPDTLIPALFGVSRGEFEGAWQAYLAQHY